MKKVLVTLLAATLLALPLSACGGTNGSSAAGEGGSGGAPPSGNSGGQVTLTFSHWGSEIDEAAYAARVELFMAQNPDINIEIQWYPSDYVQKLTTVVAGGNAPDVMVFAEDVHSFSGRGALLPLNSYLEAEGIDLAARVGQTAVDIYSANGNIYGLPDRAGGMVVFYNKDMFDAAGLSYPTASWTWDDMLTAALAMTGGEGDAATWGFATEYWWPYWMNWVMQGGGQIIDDAGNIVINSPENIASLQFLHELTSVHGVMPTRTELANIGSGASGSTLFAAGRVGFMGNGLWNIAALQEANFNWDMVEMWQGATAPFGSALCISSTCKNPDEAFRFINFMNNVESQNLIAEHVEDAPAHLEVLASPAFMDAPWTEQEVDMAVFYRTAEITYQPPITPYFSSWDTIWSDEFAGIFDGTADPATVLERVEALMLEAME